MRRAVVIGGGLAGILAAAAVVPYADQVTVVERDALPQKPQPRPGLPQAKHAHVLWSGGANAIEHLVPGVTDRWLEGGAQKIPLTSGMLAYTPHGWYRRWGPTPYYLISCSRDTLDWHVRDLVLQDPRIQLIDGVEAVALRGETRRVTGVRVVAPGAQTQNLEADLIIDASGRSSQILHWLASLGITGIPERQEDGDLVYASRIYQAPTPTDNFPLVSIQALPRSSQPAQAATLAPIEGRRWHVSLIGSRGGEPSSNNEDFVPFALQMRHPLIGMLIARATPLTDVHTTRSTSNMRRYFERAPIWPEGLVVLGDAVAAYNPVYGQGMSVAALAARQLRSELAPAGLRQSGLARRVQRALALPVDAAWSLVTAQDDFHPVLSGHAPSVSNRLMSRFYSRLSRTAASSSRMAAALTQVTTMEAPATRLLRPSVLLSAVCGPIKPPLESPPLTPEERALIDASDLP
jgi:2-polyprenyl-6-methoxyphenol hydroxylase-like FAD-dependent oxidoreductase